MNQTLTLNVLIVLCVGFIAWCEHNALALLGLLLLREPPAPMPRFMGMPMAVGQDDDDDDSKPIGFTADIH